MKTVKDYIRTIPDFPHEGIMFRDVTTLFADARGFKFPDAAAGKLEEAIARRWIGLTSIFARHKAPGTIRDKTNLTVDIPTGRVLRKPFDYRLDRPGCLGLISQQAIAFGTESNWLRLLRAATPKPERQHGGDCGNP